VEKIRKDLRPIRGRHNLTSLTLVVDTVEQQRVVLHFRATVNPSQNGPQVGLPVDTDAIFVAAVKKSGGSIEVEVDGTKHAVGLAEFEAAWPKTANRDVVLDRFRAKMEGHHEWLPSAQILDVVQRDRASQLAQTAHGWISLQHELRSNTLTVVFSPSVVRPKTANADNVFVSDSASGELFSVPQGHPGAVYFPEAERVTEKHHKQGIPQTKGHPGFNKELVGSLRGSTTPLEAAEGAEAVALHWTWDGATPTPHPVHPDAKDKGGTTVDQATQRPRFTEVKNLFTRIIGRLR
jgi:hypothetical protein